ncbi:hypothetical protein EDD80_11665 [Anseongella ginsenosidimutans]|uniref:Uncharacterized protein n=1 Tax=Anseongella ginsenosidimutans TaxID=496056 RepID=A0A4R3KLK9_9SPHI|nr:hypothetical protein EDD80_11665 [Anseongella ginsenosidimutans]
MIIYVIKVISIFVLETKDDTVVSAYLDCQKTLLIPL